VPCWTVGHHPIPHPGARISDDLAWRLFSPPIAIHTQALPTVQAARKKYLTPAVQSFAKQKKKAKIVMYLTWGYVRMRVCLSSWLCVCRDQLASAAHPVLIFYSRGLLSYNCIHFVTALCTIQFLTYSADTDTTMATLDHARHLTTPRAFLSARSPT
jgi:hypothetical protein